MQGAVDRSDIYKSVELSLDRLISEHLNHVLAAGREIRKAEVGEEAAADEERRGNIPDEDYAKDAANRREARERQRKQDATRRLREKEKERLRAEAMKKEAELERLRKADDRRRERKAREEQLQQERKKRAEEDAEWRKRDEQLRQEGAGRDDSSQRPKEESRSRQRSIERVEAAAKELSRSPHPSKEDDASTPSNAKPEIDEKAIEAAALEELLRESRELAAKSSSKPQVERSGSLEPPYRKSHMLKPRSSNISPHKSADIRQPMKPEPVKPILSFSTTNVSREATTQREPPAFLSTCSRSPTTSHRDPLGHRSRSRSRAHRGEDYSRTGGLEDRYHHKPPIISRRDSEAEQSKREAREEASSYSHHLNRDDARETEPSKHHYRQDAYDRNDRSRPRHGDYNKHDYQASHDGRSPSHGYREQDCDREREGYEDHRREYYRESRDRRRDRSRSPHRSSDHRHRFDDSKHVRSDHRPKSPVDIDRYVPGSRSKEDERDKYRHRDPENNPREERHRHREADPRDDRHRERERDRHDRDPGRYRERYDDQDRDRDRRDRDRDHHRDHNRDKEGRDDDRDRHRDKEGRYGGHERDRGKGYVEIDRYVPGGGKESQRARGRDRSR